MIDLFIISNMLTSPESSAHISSLGLKLYNLKQEQQETVLSSSDINLGGEAGKV